MKITKNHLKKLIKKELTKLSEVTDPGASALKLAREAIKGRDDVGGAPGPGGGIDVDQIDLYLGGIENTISRARQQLQSGRGRPDEIVGNAVNKINKYIATIVKLSGGAPDRPPQRQGHDNRYVNMFLKKGYRIVNNLSEAHGARRGLMTYKAVGPALVASGARGTADSHIIVLEDKIPLGERFQRDNPRGHIWLCTTDQGCTVWLRDEGSPFGNRTKLPKSFSREAVDGVAEGTIMDVRPETLGIGYDHEHPDHKARKRRVWKEVPEMKIVAILSKSPEQSR